MAKGETQDQGVIPLESELDLSDLKVGMEIFVDDGRIHLRVEELTTVKDRPALRMEVLHGGVINSRKGVNIPQLRLKADILTAKDKRDIEFGIKHGMDYVAQSFVRNAKDIDRVSALVRPALPKCQIIAKIENQEGLRNLDSIIDHSDGIMVARGDLGVSLPIYKIPMIQKDMIRRCNRRKKMVVTATQMLESMTENVRPTRAEVSDVANAIIDGTDYVMLSGETAVGAFPVKAVRMMQMIIAYTEKSLARNQGQRPKK
jgi:pyruvate kinase